MFHTYILTYARAMVDFDRASYLMVRELLQQSIDAMTHERDTYPRPDTTYDAQWVWDYYCARHYERYAEDFGPNVIPDWDQPAKPPPEPMSDEEMAEAHKEIVPLTVERAAELGIPPAAPLTPEWPWDRRPRPSTEPQDRPTSTHRDRKRT